MTLLTPYRQAYSAPEAVLKQYLPFSFESIVVLPFCSDKLLTTGTDNCIKTLKTIIVYKTQHPLQSPVSKVNNRLSSKRTAKKVQ